MVRYCKSSSPNVARKKKDMPVARVKRIKLNFRKTKRIHKNWTTTDEGSDSDSSGYDEKFEKKIKRSDRRTKKLAKKRQKRFHVDSNQHVAEELQVDLNLNVSKSQCHVKLCIHMFDIVVRSFLDQPVESVSNAPAVDLVDSNEQETEELDLDLDVLSDDSPADCLDLGAASDDEQEGGQQWGDQQEQQGDEEQDGDERQVAERAGNSQVQKLFTLSIEIQSLTIILSLLYPNWKYHFPYVSVSFRRCYPWIWTKTFVQTLVVFSSKHL